VVHGLPALLLVADSAAHDFTIHSFNDSTSSVEIFAADSKRV
jgi:hypothetical protein